MRTVWLRQLSMALTKLCWQMVLGMQQSQGEEFNKSNNQHSKMANPPYVPHVESTKSSEPNLVSKSGVSGKPACQVEPRIIQVVKKSRSYMNHTYRDFSEMVQEDDENADLLDIDDMTFPQKVHHILSQDEYQKWISWMPHGRAFRVTVPVAFEKHISAKYFGHRRYSSFLRQLSNHNFKHISQGVDRNCYYHEFMLRGYPHLCKYMPPPKEARRLISDPENEPNFYDISGMYPLSDDPNFGKQKPSVEVGSMKNEMPLGVNTKQAAGIRSASQAGLIGEPPSKRISLNPNSLQARMPIPSLNPPVPPSQEQLLRLPAFVALQHQSFLGNEMNAASSPALSAFPGSFGGNPSPTQPQLPVQSTPSLPLGLQPFDQIGQHNMQQQHCPAEQLQQHQQSQNQVQGLLGDQRRGSFHKASPK